MVREFKESDFVKIKLDSKKEDYALILQRVQKGELKWAYYATEGDKEYQYYLKINKQK
jgi:hypothetical protein